MTKLNRSALLTVVIVALFALAYIPTLIWWMFNISLPPILSHLRSLIYMGLFAAWGVSVHYRIIQKQVMQYLICIAVLMVFWVLMRELKYNWATDIDVIRALWYSYYIPLLIIPALGLLIALLLGKPENYRLPAKWTGAVLIPTMILLLLVLTNDWLQLVFTFPPGGVWMDANSTRNIGYWLIFAWELLTAFAMLGIILFKCRIPRSRTILWLPFIPLTLCVLYAVLYLTDWPVLRLFARDMTVTFCLLFTAVLESCIQCGLIQNNTNYLGLFHVSTIGAQITDEDFKVVYSAENASSVDKQTLAAAVKKPVLLAGEIRLSEASIRGGHVFWQEDLSTLLGVLNELNNTREELQSYGTLLQEENKQKARRKKLEEQQRLYDTMRAKTAGQMTLLAKLAEELESARDEDTARRLLGKIAVLGAYLKRRSNLVFLADQTGIDAMDELRLCLNESAANLRLCGVNCAFQLDFSGGKDMKAVALLYDFYEAAVELAFDTLLGLVAAFEGENGSYRLALMLRCQTDMTPLAFQFPNATANREDGLWYCTVAVPEGGDAK